MGIDVESLLADISEDEPCGEDLAYDPDFLELETLFQGRAEQVMGDSVQEAEEPDWSDIKSRALDLLGKSRDLRLIVDLTVALMKTDGLEGAASGLHLLRSTLERHWDKVHPQLDPDDDNDPLERVNIISSLVSPPMTVGDPVKFRERFASMPLINSRMLGAVSLRDSRAANNPDIAPSSDDDEGDSDSGPAKSTQEQAQRIRGAVQEVELDELTAAGELIEQVVSDIETIDTELTGYVGAASSITFDDLVKDATEARSLIQDWLAQRGVGDGSGDDDSGDGGGGGPSGGGAPGEIRSVRDVEIALNRIRDYYDASEPSSPVPVILGVAQSLISKSFLDISSALPPDAVETIVQIRDAAMGGGRSYDDDD